MDNYDQSQDESNVNNLKVQLKIRQLKDKEKQLLKEISKYISE